MKGCELRDDFDIDVSSIETTPVSTPPLVALLAEDIVQHAAHT